MPSLVVPCQSDLEAENDHPGNLPDLRWIRINFVLLIVLSFPGLFVTAAEPVLTNEQDYHELHVK